MKNDLLKWLSGQKKNGKEVKRHRMWISLLLIFCMAVSCAGNVFAEEGNEEETKEETEFIPEDYYAPIESNDLPEWPKGDAIQASSAVVMDLDTNALLYSKNAYAKMYPASITKIMTTMVALENGNLDDEITFSEIVYDIEADSTNLGIKPGEQLTLRQSLYGVMLESANDIANGVAEYVAGSVSSFADLMNAKAAQLGCVNTHFTNPHGLHNENHYTCAYDMALIAQAAYKMPQFREIISTTEYTYPKTNITDEERSFANHQKMIQNWSDYYQNWCTGGKTGFTSDAWNTLVTYGEKDGKRLVCVILHENGAARSYTETTAIMNYGFDQFKNSEITSGLSEKTFYESMRLNYLGQASLLFQSDDLKKKTAEMTKPGMVTLPDGIDKSKLTQKVIADSSGNGMIQYLYHDWNVGYGEITLTPFSLKTTLPFEQKLDVEKINSAAAVNAPKSELEQTAAVVLQNTQDFLGNTYQKTKDYIKENRMQVILVGSCILLFLMIMTIILIFRCTRDYRIQKKRKQEEKERLKMEEEIDRKTTSEIEAELRAAMEQERLKKEKEAAAIEEARRNEAKLHETERILEEISKGKQ